MAADEVDVRFLEARRDRQMGALRREGGDGEARGTSLTKDWQRLSEQPQADVETRDEGLQGRSHVCVALRCCVKPKAKSRSGSGRFDAK